MTQSGIPAVVERAAKITRNLTENAVAKPLVAAHALAAALYSMPDSADRTAAITALNAH